MSELLEFPWWLYAIPLFIGAAGVIFLIICVVADVTASINRMMFDWKERRK